MRNVAVRRWGAGLAAVLLLAAVAGCANPVKTAQKIVDPGDRAEVTAFAVYGSWVAVHAEAEVIVLDPATHPRVQQAIKDLNETTRLPALAARDSFQNYSERVREHQALLADASTPAEKLAQAKEALEAARKLFEQKALAMRTPTADLRKAMR